MESWVAQRVSLSWGAGWGSGLFPSQAAWAALPRGHREPEATWPRTGHPEGLHRAFSRAPGLHLLLPAQASRVPKPGVGLPLDSCLGRKYWRACGAALTGKAGDSPLCGPVASRQPLESTSPRWHTGMQAAPAGPLCHLLLPGASSPSDPPGCRWRDSPFAMWRGCNLAAPVGWERPTPSKKELRGIV